MPQLTFPLGPEGCALTLYVCVSAERRAALEQQKLKVPDFLQVNALIDTGASCTAIDANKLAPLQLSPTGMILVHTPSTAGRAAMMSQYDVMLGIYHDANPLIVATIPIIAVPDFSREGIDALIGRDLLSQCLFIYNGLEKQITLAF